MNFIEIIKDFQKLLVLINGSFLPKRKMFKFYILIFL